MKKILTLCAAMLMLASAAIAQNDLARRSPAGKFVPKASKAIKKHQAVKAAKAPQGIITPQGLRASLDANSPLPAFRAPLPSPKVTGNPAWNDTMSYCLNEPFASSVGAGGTLYWGIKIEAAALAGRNNITDVQFYVSSAGSYTLSLYSGTNPTGTATFTQTVTASTSDEDTWKTVHFTTPVAVNATQPLWVTLYNSGVNYPAAGVTGNSYDNGKYVSLDGSTWVLVSDYSLDYTWMIRVVSDTYTASAPTVTVDGPSTVFTGDTNLFTAVSGNATSYNWSITADYTQSAGSQALAMWNTTGSKTVSVTASNSAGSATANKTVSVVTPQVINVTNNGDGYVYVWNTLNDGQRIHGTVGVNGTSGDTLTVQLATFGPSSSYYGTICDVDASRLYTLTVDGVNIPLDGTDPDLYIDENTSNSYTLYEYYIPYSSTPHNVVATFGPYYDSTVTLNTITVDNTGNGYVISSLNGDYNPSLCYGTSTFNGPAGDSLYLGAASFLTSSEFYGELCDASNAQLTGIVIDGVSQSLDGTSSIVNVFDYASDDGYFFYELMIPFDADHTVQFLFGPWSSDTTTPTPVIPVVDTITVFPWSEDFEDTATLAAWSFVDADGDGYTWDYNYLRNSGYGHNGSNGMMASASWNSDEGALTPNNWMILPAMDLPAGSNLALTWYEKGQAADYATEYYSVYVATSIAALATATPVFSGTATASWALRNVNLSAYAGQIVYIAFRHYNVTDMFYLDIDDVAIIPAGDLPVEHTITLTHNGGYVETTHSEDLVPTSISFNSIAGDSLGIMAVSFLDDELYTMVGIDEDARFLRHVYVDGTELSLSSLESETYSEEGYNYTAYIFYVPFDTNHSVQLVFGGDETYTVTALSNDITLGTTLGGGNGFHEGDNATLMALCQVGAQFAGWSNGATANPLTLTVTGDITVTANFVPGTGGIVHDTVTIYDTVYIHDTVFVGTEPVETYETKIYGSNGQIVIEGAQAETVVLYDAVGRTLATRRSDYDALRFDIPVSGTYLVRIGSRPARRIVVVK